MTWNLPETFIGNSEGLYFYRLNSGTEIQGGKLILIE